MSEGKESYFLVGPTCKNNPLYFVKKVEWKGGLQWKDVNC